MKKGKFIKKIDVVFACCLYECAMDYYLLELPNIKDKINVIIENEK